MDHAPEEMSLFLASGKETLSPEALSTLRVMAFLDPQHFLKDIFEGHRLLFKAKNEELMFHFPTTAAAHTEACAELVEASLVQLSEEDMELSMRPEIQTSVLADLHKTGLISPLFNATVKTLTGLWPQMVCVPDRTVDPVEFAVATAPGTDYEEYLKTRHSAGQTSQFQEYVQYARVNIWGQRDELVHHIARLEHIFYQSDDDMVEVCATNTFAQLLTEAAWYYFERSRYDDAEVKIQAALGVYGLARGKSSLHQASTNRVHAAIALERGKHDNAAQYVELQMEQLELPWLQQRQALDNAAQYVKLQVEQVGLSWLQQRQALKESGLLDRAPDAVALSPWGLDIPPGMFVVLPLRSICSFGWKLYLDAQNKKEPQYLQYLDQAALCFSTVLKDRTDVLKDSERRNTRTGELLYALGNVANKHARFLGQLYMDESLKAYENALSHFQGAVPDIFSAVGMAKTHYKLAVHSIRSRSYERAKYELPWQMQELADTAHRYHVDEAMQLYGSNAAYHHHLARLVFQRSRIKTLTGSPSAKLTLHSAFSIRRQIRPTGNRIAEEMTEADFDELIGIWER